MLYFRILTSSLALLLKNVTEAARVYNIIEKTVPIFRSPEFLGVFQS